MRISETNRPRLTAKRTLGVIAATALSLGMISAAHDAGEAHATKLPIHREVVATACAQEDGSGSLLPCFWDAKVQGNGMGHSFTIRRVGTNLKCFTYWNRSYNIQHGFCELLRPRKAVQMREVDGHQSCIIRVGPTSLVTCPDGYRTTS